MGKNFYEDLLDNSFYKKDNLEKQASEDIKQKLSSYTDEQLEALAQEFNLFEKKAESLSVEERATEKALATAGKSESNHTKQNSQDINEGMPDETQYENAKINKAHKDADANYDGEEYNDHGYRVHDTSKLLNAKVPTDQVGEANLDPNADPDYKSASEYLKEMLKTASSEEEAEEMLKIASYYRAEEMLGEAGYSLADYVYSIVENEKIALDVAEQSEKLATITEQPIIKVAFDILGAMEDVVEYLEEQE